MSDDDYVDYHGLAKRMGVSVPTLKRWVALGMPSETWGLRARRFQPSRCMAWRREQG